MYIYSWFYNVTTTDAGPGTNVVLGERARSCLAHVKKCLCCSCLTVGCACSTAQLIFAGLYVASIATMLIIMYLTKPCPPYVALLLCVSKRLHSIFVLRLFNDGIAMLLLFVAVAVFCTSWRRKVSMS